MKKQLFLLAAILAMASSTPTWAYDFSAVAPSGQTLYYNIVNDNAQVTYQNSGYPIYSTYPTGDLVIPPSVTYNNTTYPVTSIGNYAFTGCRGLTSVTIPNSVTSIDDDAFHNCSGLTSVTIPDSVTTIGSSAFESCSGLTSVTIGNSVTMIGNDAFSGCTGLTSVIIPDSVTWIGNYSFYNCSGLTSVTIGSGVIWIASRAFEGCSGLTSVTIPNSVTSIDNAAFSGCTSLTSVTIGNSVTSIGNFAFHDCTSLTSTIYTGTIAQWCGISFGNYCANPLYYSHSLTIGGTEITNLVIPNGVTEIKQYAFDNCRSLTSVTIPNSVTSIGNYAFSGCTGLTSVTIPNSVTSIGNSAFSGCTGLTSVIIPNSVTSIGSSAFRNVRHIEYYGSATGSPWGAISMNGITEGDFVYSDATKHNLVAYVGNGGNIIIPSNVETIGNKAFYGCTSPTSVTIPNSVTSIGSYAFYGFVGLTSVTIPNSVTSISNYAFDSCISLTSTIYTGTIAQWCGISFGHYSATPLYYSHSLTIGGTEITNLVIPNGVTEIKQRAFAYCTGLTSVTIPSSVTSIGEYAFHNCTGLTSTIYTGTIAQWCNISFGYANGVGTANPLYYSHSLTIGGSEVTNLVIPNGVTKIKHHAFSYCTSLTSVTIPNSVTSIGEDAFYYCTGLTSVTIGNSVTSIGNAAFYSCSGLTSVTIPNSVTTIGGYAFRYSSGLTSFTIGSGVTSIGVRALGDCTGLRNIISKAVYPPTASDNTFENVPPYCTLTVPCGSLQYYQETPLWNTQFPLMEEDCNPDGIDDTEIGDVMVYAANGMIYISSTLPTETTIFDITGHQVATFTAEAASIPLPAGVYLVKVGAYPARKVVVIR